MKADLAKAKALIFQSWIGMPGKEFTKTYSLKSIPV